MTLLYSLVSLTRSDAQFRKWHAFRHKITLLHGLIMGWRRPSSLDLEVLWLQRLTSLTSLQFTFKFQHKNIASMSRIWSIPYRYYVEIEKFDTEASLSRRAAAAAAPAGACWGAARSPAGKSARQLLQLTWKEGLVYVNVRHLPPHTCPHLGHLPS